MMGRRRMELKSTLFFLMCASNTLVSNFSSLPKNKHLQMAAVSVFSFISLLRAAQGTLRLKYTPLLLPILLKLRS
jgi:hypothetical protein